MVTAEMPSSSSKRVVMPQSSEKRVEMPPLSSEKRVITEDEDPQKLIASRKRIRTDCVTVGVILLIIILSLLCSFLIPGLSLYNKYMLWQLGALLFIGTAIFIGVEYGSCLSSSHTNEEPKPLTGADLC